MIGILGGYGGVGQATAQRLAAWGVKDLRIGGRSARCAQDFVNQRLGGNAEVMAVDIENARELASFCLGCTLVVNCAGPSYYVLDKVASACLGAGADYVDPGGDQYVYERMAEREWIAAGQTAVLSAGMIPGLSGLLPKWLAQQDFASRRALGAWVCLKDRFTPAAAREYAYSLSNRYGESLAAWRNGRRAPRALQPLLGVRLPFFSRPVSAYPYLSSEAERLAKALDLSDLSWYNVFEGHHVLEAIGRLQAVDAEKRDVASARLAEAAELDLFGQSPSQFFVFQLEGQDHQSTPAKRTLLLRGNDSYELSGLVAAHAVMKILGGAIRPGVHFAMDVLDPNDTVEQLRHSDAVAQIELIDHSEQDAGGEESSALEEGVL